MIAELTEQQIQDSKMNKKFLALIYEDEDNLPAYNFFKAETDATFLLKDRTFKVTDAQLLFLASKYMHFINQWNMLRTPDEYTEGRRLQAKYLFFKTKRILLTTVIETFKGKESEDMIFIMGELAHETLKDWLNSYGIPIMKTCGEQMEVCNRFLKGLSFDVNVAKAELDKAQKKNVNTKKYNFTEDVARYNAMTKQSINYMTVSLSMWGNSLNILEEK